MVLDEVDRGLLLAAFAVNFDGLARSDASDGRVVYVNPPGETTVTPDITSVLRSAKDAELAEDFVRYCLSETGQVVWGVRAEATGRSTDTLYHYPIDPAIYAKYAGKLAVKENPYEADFGLKIDPKESEELAAALVPIMRAAAGDNHILLQQAWAAIVKSGMNEAALKLLTEPPMTREEAVLLGKAYQAADAEHREGLAGDWVGKFRERYQQALELAHP